MSVFFRWIFGSAPPGSSWWGSEGDGLDGTEIDMDEDTRVGGNGLVRLEALTYRYTKARDEAELETALADELTAQGWTVERQVWCRPMDENKYRRIDLHASGRAFSHDLAHPLTLGVELKFDAGFASARDAMKQIRRYRQSSGWCDGDAEMMVPPVWFLFTNRAMLGADVRVQPTGPLFDRMLWEMGASRLFRGRDGNLWMSVRFPRVNRNGDRRYLTTKDRYVQVTRWNTGRRP